MDNKYLSSTGFISAIVGVTLHGSSFKNRHFVRSATCAKELDYTTDPEIFLYYF